MVQLSEMRDTMIKEMYIQLAIEDITREMIEELTHIERVRRIDHAAGECL